MKSRKMLSINSVIGVGLLFLTGILIFMLPFYIAGSSNNKKVKPLIVIKDANRPSLSFDGSRIVEGPEIGLSEVYDVNTGKKLGTYRVKDSESEAISSDGKIVRIFGGRGYTTYDIDTGKILSQGDTSISKDGKIIGYVNIANDGGMTSKTISSDLDVVAQEYPIWGRKNTSDQPAVIVGRLSGHSLIAELKTDDGYVDSDIWDNVTMTPDGKFVAAGRSNNYDKTRYITVLWEVSTGKVILTLPFSSHWLSLSDDGQRPVTKKRGDEGKIEVWNVTTGKLISTITQVANGQKILVSRGVVSPDGKLLVTTRNMDFYFWDTTTGKYITSQKQDDISEGNVKSVTFSGNGKRIAVGSDTEVITVWSVDEILKNAKGN